jgi:SNF2 family DNA or RNA helicase
MLNFRKLKQDFSSNIVKEGKLLFDNKKVISAKILKLDNDTVRFSGKILSNFGTTYETEVEIDRIESEFIHSNCDCPYRFDCQHIAALIFYLEENLNSILVEYSNDTDIVANNKMDEGEKQDLIATIKAAETKAASKKDARYKRQVLQEYATCAEMLASSAFFLPHQEITVLNAELGFIFNSASLIKNKVEFQLALRLPFRSKPLAISHIQRFLDAISYKEPVAIGGKHYFFTNASFKDIDNVIIDMMVHHASFVENGANDRGSKVAYLDKEHFGMLLAKIRGKINEETFKNFNALEGELPIIPSIFVNSLETPLLCSIQPVNLRFELEYVASDHGKILLNPKVEADGNVVELEKTCLFECAHCGMIYKDIYYPFNEQIKRRHLNELANIKNITIPEPLFGSFIENGIPELSRFASISNKEVIDKCVTLPYAKPITGRCELTYLNGELEANLFFIYDGNEVHSSYKNLTIKNIEGFVSEQGIVARNLVEERRILEGLFQDFIYNADNGTYVAKSEKKIVEFMTETVPQYQNNIKFNCPQNLLDQFIYDKTKFTLTLDYKDKLGFYTLDLKVDGELKGVKLDLLWECVSMRRTFVEINSMKNKDKNKEESRFSKILVLDLERISRIAQIFDELGITVLETQLTDKPLWSLVNIDDALFDALPIKFSMSAKLKSIKEQMLGIKEFKPSPIPEDVKAILRPYQVEGIYWLERLRCMYLNGILADDMGLGKTLQAIVAIAQHYKQEPKTVSLIICPTSLIYNWKEEFNRFFPKAKAVVVDGSPSQRKKIINDIGEYNVAITSYTLLQKDIEYYQNMQFSYVILDEAQHIKNRLTRNAKSAKMLKSAYKLILTGTPIENSLEELWSLFDFLMPGFLSSSGEAHGKNIEYLKKKVAPFILRRMKNDVLKELPAVSEIVYHCQLSELQRQLYKSYVKTAKEELVKLVEKEGFEKVQIHVLATLTRLKQICCHPAIFAKESPEIGDSAKYDMLVELLQNLVESGHKTVVFSQYTKMLQIMKDDFMQKGIRFAYLDGASKNRLQIVQDFNENRDIPVFLVSLKAGGTGLNIIGADTVIHYDMWWNPAVENQATDRVHRIGQKKAVSAYKLVTLDSIEEKIVEMQKRKKGLVKKVVSCDDEAIAKLTWEEVLELLQV